MVLPVAVYILELARVADSERGNPVKVVRAISAGVRPRGGAGARIGNTIFKPFIFL